MVARPPMANMVRIMVGMDVMPWNAALMARVPAPVTTPNMTAVTAEVLVELASLSVEAATTSIWMARLFFRVSQ